MEAIKELEDVLAKTAKNISNKNRERAVEALGVFFAETNDPKQLVEYLIRFHYSVCQAFLEEFCSSASDESILAIAEALVNNEQFIKGKPSNVMYPKGFTAVFTLASKEKYQPSLLILLPILSQSKKLDGFSEGCVNNFKKLVVDKGGLPFMTTLLEQVENGQVVCKKYEQKLFAEFLGVIESKEIESRKKEISTSAEKSESVISKVEKTQQEILVSLRRLAENRTSIDILAATIARKDDELNSLRTALLEKEDRVVSLISEAAAKDMQLSEAKEKIENLTQRLRASFQMDNIAKSQELLTLKNDLSEALKLDYADYTKSKNSPYSEDLFEAYRSTLTRIFKLLKRFDITCQ